MSTLEYEKVFYESLGREFFRISINDLCHESLTARFRILDTLGYIYMREAVWTPELGYIYMREAVWTPEREVV